MNKIDLNLILKQHVLWLNNVGGKRADLTHADLTNADLTDADLTHADLRGANLDFSSMPLWCGDLKANYDDKQIIQQLFHVMSHIKNSANASDEIKQLLNDENLEWANKFHRVNQCGIITK